jgi:5-methylcytosine-specific restriction endonuclease McrA
VIKIDRGPMPQALRAFAAATVRGDNGAMVTRDEREKQRARAFYLDPTNFANNQKLTNKTFEFAIYKDKELSRELDRVFGTKCAYCESNFGAVTPDDVEHFRPKSAITTDTGELNPGYFWLASEWTNLLVACRDCNAGRYFEVPGQPDEVRLGKLAQFPLSNEVDRYRGPGPGIGDELQLQLLLDPCTDEPSEHLTWNEGALILPKSTPGSGPSPKGLTSIFVYALQRKGLVEARLETLLNFRRHVRSLQKAVHRLNDANARGDPTAVTEELETIEELKDAITGMLAVRVPPGIRQPSYVGMLRDWIRTRQAAGRFVDLEQFGINLLRFV